MNRCFKGVAYGAALALLQAGCISKQIPLGMGDPAVGVTVRWHGQSSVSIEDSVGRVVTIDPFDETVGYDVPSLRADAVLVTHDHFDHANLRIVRRRAGAFDIVEGTGTKTVAGDLSVQGIPSAHDAEDGALHGPNTIFAFTMGGLRIVHLGDIGQPALTPYQRSVIGEVDILFVPVGGFVTIGPIQAKAIVEQLRPGAVFPLHHGDIRFYKLAPVSDFTALFPPAQVVAPDAPSVQLKKSDLAPPVDVYVLKPSDTNY